jgi:hypothetical protein
MYTQKSHQKNVGCSKYENKLDEELLMPLGIVMLQEGSLFCKLLTNQRVLKCTCSLEIAYECFVRVDAIFRIPLNEAKTGSDIILHP